MSILRRLWQWLAEPSVDGVSVNWTQSQKYDRSGWEGPTFKGRFRR